MSDDSYVPKLLHLIDEASSYAEGSEERRAYVEQVRDNPELAEKLEQLTKSGDREQQLRFMHRKIWLEQQSD